MPQRLHKCLALRGEVKTEREFDILIYISVCWVSVCWVSMLGICIARALRINLLRLCVNVLGEHAGNVVTAALHCEGTCKEAFLVSEHTSFVSLRGCAPLLAQSAGRAEGGCQGAQAWGELLCNNLL